MGSDEMIQFEESHYDDLVDKFIEKYRDKWEEFVMKMYENNTIEQCLEKEIE